jgi:glycosyltransferase involved in cell wall biosynthesis
MKISFIIPTLNEEILLPVLLKQLFDIRNKDNYDFEIIISDGGSKDSTLSIAEKFADTIVKNESNNDQNIATGRNCGAAAAKGEILVFLNGDIRISDTEKFLLEIYNDFYPENKYLAMTCFVDVFPEEKILSDKIFITFYNKYFRLINFLGLGMGRGECHIIRKNIFNELGGYNEKLVAGEDFELFTRIRKKGKIFYSTKFKVFESPRRYRKLGHIRILVTWFINSIFVLITKKSLSNKWEEVR